MVSDVDDLARYMTALFRGRLVDTDSMNAMFTPFTLRSGAESPYGLGWFVTFYAGEKIIWGYGQETTFSALLLYVPERHIGTIMLANSVAMSDPFWLIFGDLLHSPFAVAFLNDVAFREKPVGLTDRELDEGFTDSWLGESSAATVHLKRALVPLPEFERYDPAVLAILSSSNDASLLEIGGRVAMNLLATDPDNPRTRFDYAMLLMRQKRFGAAAKLLRPLAAHPDSSLPWVRTEAASVLRQLPAPQN